MALEIRNAERASAGGIVADRRLYLTKDTATRVDAEPGQRVVEEGDADAAFLLVGPGGTIPADQVAALGLELEDGKVVQSTATRAEVASDQQAEKEPAAKESQANEETTPVGAEAEKESTAEKEPAAKKAAAKRTRGK